MLKSARRQPEHVARCWYVALLLVFLSPLTRAHCQDIQSEMARLFQSHAQTDVPGAAVAVMRNGQTLFKAAYGAANVEEGVAATTDTAFHLGSVGKQITAVAVLMLVQEGKLSLNEPVHKYLSQFRGWGKRVTIRQLLHHTSGVPDYYEDIESEYRRPTNKQALRYLAELASLDFKPGSRFSYSNSGYDTLGALVEKVSKRRFGVFMEERIFAPYGMASSFAFDANRRAASKRAIGYSEENGERYVDDTSTLNALHGSGSIYSTVEDMVRYDEALFGYRLVSKSTLDLAFVSGKLNNGRLTGYGFGWDILTDNELGLPYYGHSGEWMGFSAYYLHYPSTQLSVIVVSNLSSADIETLAFGTAAIATRANL